MILPAALAISWLWEASSQQLGGIYKLSLSFSLSALRTEPHAEETKKERKGAVGGLPGSGGFVLRAARDARDPGVEDGAKRRRRPGEAGLSPAAGELVDARDSVGSL